MGMKKEQAEALVTEHMSRYKDILKVWNWNIELHYGVCNDDAFGECVTLAEYRKATITINLAKHDSPRQFLSTLFHELLHVCTADFDLVQGYMRAFLKDKGERDGFDVIFYQCCERVVWQLEQVFESQIMPEEAAA
jgi:hypothetical protein